MHIVASLRQLQKLEHLELLCDFVSLDNISLLDVCLDLPLLHSLKISGLTVSSEPELVEILRKVPQSNLRVVSLGLHALTPISESIYVSLADSKITDLAVSGDGDLPLAGRCFDSFTKNTTLRALRLMHSLQWSAIEDQTLCVQSQPSL